MTGAPDLFRGDPVGRWVEAGLPFARWNRPLVVLAAAVVSWGGLALLSFMQGPQTGLAFLGDYAAVAQYLFAIPILLAVEPWIDRRVAGLPRHLVGGGLLRETQPIEEAWRSVGRLNRVGWHYVVLVVAAYTLTWCWLGSEIADCLTNWRMTAGGMHPGGWWIGLVALPLFHFLWLRWAAKLLLWTWFLQRLARSDLRLSAHHPDGAGGLAFLGQIQASFGILMFVFGVVTTATAFYDIHVAGVSPTGFLGLGLIILYLAFAPVLFLAPLLVFTVRLREVKEMALLHCAKGIAGQQQEGPSVDELEAIAHWQVAYERVLAMRTLPFDFKTLRQLAVTAGAPVVPLVAQFLPWESLRESLRMLFGS